MEDKIINKQPMSIGANNFKVLLFLEKFGECLAKAIDISLDFKGNHVYIKQCYEDGLIERRINQEDKREVFYKLSFNGSTQIQIIKDKKDLGNEPHFTKHIIDTENFISELVLKTTI